MDNTDYTIIKTNNINDIKKDDYILYNDEIYQIMYHKYGTNKNICHSVIYKCIKPFKSNIHVDFVRFDLENKYYEFKHGYTTKIPIEKIFFTIKIGTIIDYDISTKIITILTETNDILELKNNNNVDLDVDSDIKYIKYNDDYKIL